MSTSPWKKRPSDVLRVGDGFSLRELAPRATPGFKGGKRAGKAVMGEHGAELSDLQERLFAEGRSGGDRSVLLVLQGMDTSGKGGIVRHVLGMVDPQGVVSRSFGPPTEEELKHHYLWRVRRSLPPAGRIGVFDRSHYEDVLVARVDGLVPGDPWETRFREINRFERQAADAGITVIKCMLVISPEEQLQRLSERIQRPDKHWKYSPSDLDARAKWDEYLDAYQAVLDQTSTEQAPWFAIPADRKWYARLAVTQVLVDTLRDLDPQWPTATFDVQEQTDRISALRIEAGLPPLAGAAPDTTPPAKKSKKNKGKKKAKKAAKAKRSTS